MARRPRRVTPLLTIVLVAAASLAFVVASDWTPRLGLDLQGGASVVYEAANEVPDEALDDAIEIIRSRVDALGVAEPEIVREGDSIVVNLPGVEDQDRALEVIGRTAELQFRPVLASQPYIDPQALADANDGSTTTTAPDDTGSTDTTAPGDTATTAPGDTATSDTTATSEPSTATSEGALGLAAGESAGAAPARQEPTTTTTAAPEDGSSTTATTAPPADGATSTTDTTVPGGTTTTLPTDPEDVDPCVLLGGSTPAEEATTEATVVFPEDDPGDRQRLCYQLGPIPSEGERTLTGRIVTGPEATINTGEWGVSLGIRGDDLGLFNSISTACFSGLPNCPAQSAGGTGQLAIALDGVVQSALGFQTPTFDSNGLLISGSFTEREARDLALVLRFGALPVELERVNFENVSPTLGEESLDAGLVAGVIGIVAVSLYMLLYYRALGVVVLLGLVVWSALLYALICYLSEKQGLTLSLAGVAGLVVSVGVTVDSYVVFFERLREEVRAGRTLRVSVDRGFSRAFKTVLAANATSFIGAFLLYVLTIGSVRGFAFMLGLSTILDVVVAWFFTRPLVVLLGRTDLATRNRWFGIARGTAAPVAPGTGQ